MVHGLMVHSIAVHRAVAEPSPATHAKWQRLYFTGEKSVGAMMRFSCFSSSSRR